MRTVVGGGSGSGGGGGGGVATTVADDAEGHVLVGKPTWTSSLGGM
jgi:hypothetical protein